MKYIEWSNEFATKTYNLQLNLCQLYSLKIYNPFKELVLVHLNIPSNK